MIPEWRKLTLKKAGVLLLDCVHKTPEARSDGIPYIAIPQISDGRINFDANPRLISEVDYLDWTRKACPAANDVVLSRRCNPGETAYVEVGAKFALGQNLVLLRATDKNKVFPPYLRWIVRGGEWWSEVERYLNAGAIFDSLKCADIPNFELTFPPIQTQKSIVNVLATLANKIELNRKLNQTLESIAQALFKSWFVDFDPVIDNAIAAGNPIPEHFQARAERRRLRLHEPVQEGQSPLHPLPSELRHLFPNSFQETEALGWVPQGWEVNSLSDFGQIICGKTPSKGEAEFFGKEIPFIKIPDMHSQMYAVKTEDGLSLAGANSQSKKTIPKGTICVSCIATVGKVVIAAKESQTNQQINSIVPRQLEFTPYLYFQMLMHTNMLHDLASGGSATLNLNTGNFSKIRVIKPPDKLLTEYYSKAEPCFESILCRSYENISLEKLRDFLLPKLLSGQLRIPDAEAQLAEAGL